MSDKHIQTKFLIPSWLSYSLFFVGLIALLGALYLSIHTTQQIRRNFHGFMRQTDVTLIQNWMTIPYVARSYHVPEDVLLKAVNTEGRDVRRTSIKKLASELHESPDLLLLKMREAISTYQKTHPESSPVPTL